MSGPKDYSHHATRQKLQLGSMADNICQFMCFCGHTPHKHVSEMTPEDWAFRDKLNEEEITEMLDAYELLRENPSLENLAAYTKEVLDVVYVAVGSLVKMGVPTDLCWDEVQRSNMEKIHPDGTVHRREDGKILKPEGWKPADLLSILQKYYGASSI